MTNSWLPESEGLLPYWLLFVSVLAVGNTIQAFITNEFTDQVYLNAGEATKRAKKSPSPTSVAQTSPLQSRLFGVWTFLSSVIRVHAAYDISNPSLYRLALASYALAGAHFYSEWLVFGSARWGRGLAGPIFVASGSTLWMLSQWSFYVK